MRQHVEAGHSEHHPRDSAQRELERAVSEPDADRHSAARKACRAHGGKGDGQRDGR